MPKSVIFVSLILLGWLGGGTWWWVCKHRGLCPGQSTSVSANLPATPDVSAEIPTTSPKMKMPFSIEYQGKPWFQVSDQLRFGKSNPLGFIPGSIKVGLDSLASFLRNHPEKDLEITGSYASSEENTSDKLNLGLGRTGFIQQELMARGVDADRFIQLPKVVSMEDYFGDGDTLYGGIGLKLLDNNSKLAEADANARLAGSSDENAETAEPTVSFEPRNFLFELAQSDLVLSPEDRSYITSVIQYLRQHPNSKLSLTGHADNTGTPAKNMEYGRKRANTVKQYFTSFGLSASQITTDSKGDRSPTQSNATEEGRRQNRRVEVRVAN